MPGFAIRHEREFHQVCGDAWMSIVHEQEFDLLIGEALRIGDRIVTIVDVDGIEVGFRIDNLFDEHLDKDEYLILSN